MIRETVTVVRLTEETDSLDPTPADPVDPRDVPGCNVVPIIAGQVDETEFQGQVIVADYFIKMPRGTDILATDQIVVRGETCEVVGRPADYGRKGVCFYAKHIGTQ